MKKQKISLLALAVLAGGITAASAATAKVENAATFNAKVTLPTNAPIVFVDPSSVPRSLIVTGLVANPLQTIVDTDGAGKIEGTTLITFGQSTNTGYVRFLTSVKGSIKGKDASVPTVDISLKGNGYSALSTNLGEFYSAIGVPASLSLKFKSGSILTSSNLAGTFDGSIKSGVPAIDNLTSNGRLKGSAAVLDISTFTASTIDHTVIQAGDKLYVQSGTIGTFTGTGTAKVGKKANVSLKGIGSTKGSSYKLSGTSASIPIISGGATNSVTFFSTTEVSGKAYGQDFKRNGTVTTSATLVPIIVED